MSKKLLASLIALTMVSAFACGGGEDDKKDEGCTASAIKCTDGQDAIKVCVDNSWMDTSCTAMNNNVPGYVCKNNQCVLSSQPGPGPQPTACTDGTFQCTGLVLQQCTGGNWNTVKTCSENQVCNATEKDCKAKDPSVGNDCDDTYVATCINDGANALVCNNGKIAQWTCAENKCTPKGSTADCPKSTTPTGEACTATSTAKCDDACSEDKLTRWYWNGSTVVEKKCKEATCVPEDKDSCVAEGGGTQDPTVGQACDDSYVATCINDGANALVCNKGKVAQWTCDGNKCTANGSTADCPKPGSGSGEKCTATSTAKCDKTCNDDKSEGYYWGNDKLNVKKCANKDCYINSKNYVACESEDVATDPSVGSKCDDSYKATCINDGANALVCNNGKVAQWTCDGNKCTAKGSTADCPKPGSGTTETCTGEDYTGTCAADNKTAVVCVKGETKNYTCFNDICETRKDGTIYCPKDQKAIDNEEARKACEDKEQIKEGGKVGDCCDTENYKPAGCDTAKNSGLRCSTGVIVEWTCTSPKVCNFDPESTEYPGGKYSCK